MPRSVPQPAWVLTRRRAVGERIRAAREAAELTQQQVAERIQMDRATYNRIEMGHASPLLDAVVRGAVHLDAFGDLLLRQLCGLAGGADVVSDGPAAGNHPGGRGYGARHLSTLTAP